MTAIIRLDSAFTYHRRMRTDDISIQIKLCWPVLSVF